MILSARKISQMEFQSLQDFLSQYYRIFKTLWIMDKIETEKHFQIKI